MSRVLYLVTCGAPLASRTGDGVREPRARGWDPAVIPTDAATAWIDESAKSARRVGDVDCTA